MVLAVVSCQNDFDGTNLRGDEVAVTLNVAVPDDATRAAGSDSAKSGLQNIDLVNGYDIRYILEVYDANGTLAKPRIVKCEDKSASTSFDLRLVPGRDYRFVVWADFVLQGTNQDLHYNTTDIKAISLNGEQKANDESRDAYTCVRLVEKFQSGAPIAIELKRPFAKLRVVTTDMNHLYSPLKSVTVDYTTPIYTTFNALTEEKGGLQDVATKVVDFTKKVTETEGDYVYVYTEQEYKDAGKMTLFADYFFGAEDDAIHFTLDAEDATGMDIPEVVFNTNIPVQRNYLTTVMGPVLTDAANVTVIINDAFENDGHFEDAPYYQVAVSTGVELIKALLAGQEIIVLNDITVTAADLAEATRAGDPINPVLNLNGFIITIENNGTDALVNLNGGALTVEGEGAIELSNTNVGAFVEGAIVVTEKAEVDAEAAVDENGNSAVKTGLDALVYICENGGEFNFTDNLEATKVIEIKTTKPVVINGNGKTISFTSNRGFRVTASNNVTIENATIVNNVDNGRCIETRTGNINLTLNNVNLTATQTGSQPFTVGGSGINVTVNINNSTINAGKGYGITTFNPTALTINNSTVTGYAALNIKVASGSEGSAGSVINVTGSTLAGVNNWPGVSNAFSTIMLEDSDVTINIDSTSTVKAFATDNIQTAINLGNELVDTLIGNCDITIAGTVVLEGEDALYALCSTKQGSTGTNAVKFNAEYAEELQAEGWIVSEPTDSLVTITSAVAKLNGNRYTTLEAAVAAAEEGATITLLKDVTLAEELALPAGIIFNGNGKQINGTIYAGGNLTFVGHTKVTAFSASYYNRVITIGEGACLEVTGTGRVTLGYGNIFNITGSVVNAKTADKANIQPSLIIPGGISITGGNDATMNVNNAYVKIGSTSSKNSAANGTFTLNFNNAVAEFTNQLTFAEPTNGMNPTFNLNIVNSVLTTGTKLILAAPLCEMNVDNSTINISTYFGNSGVVTLTNGSELTGSSIQDNEGINHRGSTTVDNSTFTINATSPGHAFDGKGTGSITATNGATVAVQYYKDMTINVDATSTFTGTDIYGNRKIHYVSEEMKLEPTTPGALGGATIVSNVWDKTTGKGVITFDRDLTIIGIKHSRVVQTLFHQTGLQA